MDIFKIKITVLGGRFCGDQENIIIERARERTYSGQEGTFTKGDHEQSYIADS